MWPRWYFETSSRIQELETAPFFARHLGCPYPYLGRYRPSFPHIYQSFRLCALASYPYPDFDFETSSETYPSRPDDPCSGPGPGPGPDFCFCCGVDPHVFLYPYPRHHHAHRRSHSVEGRQKIAQEQTLLPLVLSVPEVEVAEVAAAQPVPWSSTPGELPRDHALPCLSLKIDFEEKGEASALRSQVKDSWKKGTF